MAAGWNKKGCVLVVDISDDEFEELVGEALDAIPPRFTRRLGNVAILIEDRDPRSDTILGFYHGVPLPARTFDHSGLPSSITIYRESLKRYCRSREELAEQVRTTVGHEIGHHFGLDDDELHRLGWG